MNQTEAYRKARRHGWRYEQQHRHFLLMSRRVRGRRVGIVINNDGSVGLTVRVRKA